MQCYAAGCTEILLAFINFQSTFGRLCVVSGLASLMFLFSWHVVDVGSLYISVSDVEFSFMKLESMLNYSVGILEPVFANII